MKGCGMRDAVVDYDLKILFSRWNIERFRDGGNILSRISYLASRIWYLVSRISLTHYHSSFISCSGGLPPAPSARSRMNI
jgi:hypothetical protein